MDVKVREEVPLDQLGLESRSESQLVGEAALPALVRRYALRANYCCLGYMRKQQGDQISNWEARVHQIREISNRYASPVVVPMYSPAQHSQALQRVGSGGVRGVR